MRVAALYGIEFETDNPHGIVPATKALKTLIEQIDPGLTVFIVQLPKLTVNERAELETLRDLRQRFIGFGGNDFTIAPWISAHRLHADEPYMGCPFCRDRFMLKPDPEAHHQSCTVLSDDPKIRAHGCTCNRVDTDTET